MSLDASQMLSPSSELRTHVIRWVGAGATATKVTGPGMSVVRTSSGLYTITWSDAPGVLQGLNYALQATTPDDIKGHSVVFGAFAAGGTTLAVSVFEQSGPTLHDLAALEWLTVTAYFAHTNLNNA